MIIEVESLESFNYATLSYVWGSPEDQLRLRRQDVEPRDEYSSPWKYPEIPYGLIPRTIRDAMSVATEMGLDYMWVDALCIVQDDQADLEVQIGSMAQIYTNANLCIVVATNEPLTSGIRGFSVSRESTIQRVTDVAPDLTIGITQLDIYTILSRSKWASRAWTYQEHMLSRRSIIFTNSEMLFHCGTETHREYCSGTWREASVLDWGESSLIGNQSSMATTYFRQLGAISDDMLREKTQFITDYEMSAREYSQRKLSYDSDALNAFAGMTALWSRNMKTEMVYGHPQPILLRSLFWGPVRKMGREVSLRRRSTSESLPSSQVVPGQSLSSIETSARPLFPSWTWAAWEGGVKFHTFDGGLSVPDSVNFPLGPTAYSGMESMGLESKFAIEIRNGKPCLVGIIPLFTNVANFKIDTDATKTRHFNFPNTREYFLGNADIRNSTGLRVGVLSIAQNQLSDVPSVGTLLLLGMAGDFGCAVMYVDLVEYDFAADSVGCDDIIEAGRMTETAVGFGASIRTLKRDSTRPIYLARRIGVGVIEAAAWRESKPQHTLLLLG